VDRCSAGLAQLPALHPRRDRAQGGHEAFVHQGGYRHRPAAADLADQPVAVDVRAGEEHLVEAVRAVHLMQRAHLDAGLVDVDDEVAEALVLRHADVGPREQHAAVGELGP
jgi:hypothetical protein